MGKTKASTASKAPAEPSAPADDGLRRDPDGNVMDGTYYFKQYIGLLFACVAMAAVCVAGYVSQIPWLAKWGFTTNHFLYGGVVLGLVGLFFHESRPYRTKVTFTFEKEAVEARKREIAEAEAAMRKESKKKK